MSEIMPAPSDDEHFVGLNVKHKLKCYLNVHYTLLAVYGSLMVEFKIV